MDEMTPHPEQHIAHKSDIIPHVYTRDKYNWSDETHLNDSAKD